MNINRLAIILYIMAAPTLAGAAVTAVLTMRGFTTQMLVGAAVAGFLVALPVAWLAAKNITAKRR